MPFLIFATSILLIIGFFSPRVSLFWYNKERTKFLSSVIYGPLTFLLICAQVSGDKNPETSKEASSPMVTVASDSAKIDTGANISSAVPEQKIETEEYRVKKKLKLRAERDWPNDYTTQEYWINQELEDYGYMNTIPDGPIKRQAERDWPYDFTTQKFWYDQQVEARERLNNE